MTLHEFAAMGTTVSLIGSRREKRHVVDWFEAVEQTCSRFRPNSELSAINGSACDQVTLSPLLADVMAEAQRIRSATGGLVDAAVGAAVCAWGYDASFEEGCDRDELPMCTGDVVREWSVANGILHKTPGTRFDLGGIAKGWACDVAVERGLAQAVSAGGDLRSSDPETMVGIKDPWGTIVASVEVGARALATSSTMRRRWRVAGQQAHHLIDPRTDAPAETPVLSASVIAGRAVDAEAGAKSVLLRGEHGLVWAAETEWITGALVVWHDGSVFATKGMGV